MRHFCPAKGMFFKREISESELSCFLVLFLWKIFEIIISKSFDRNSINSFHAPFTVKTVSAFKTDKLMNWYQLLLLMHSKPEYLSLELSNFVHKMHFIFLAFFDLGCFLFWFLSLIFLDHKYQMNFYSVSSIMNIEYIKLYFVFSFTSKDENTFK